MQLKASLLYFSFPKHQFGSISPLVQHFKGRKLQWCTRVHINHSTSLKDITRSGMVPTSPIRHVCLMWPFAVSLSEWWHTFSNILWRLNLRDLCQQNQSHLWRQSAGQPNLIKTNWGMWHSCFPDAEEELELLMIKPEITWKILNNTNWAAELTPSIYRTFW